ncbi:MAG: CHAD domain-containing protein [Spirochaetes bacterium]|nr:MAG: CHAD domain-containing protein [Spirochaetota bacterium]
MHPIIKDSLQERYETFCAELAKCRHHPSLEGVHDLRVSIRRLNAVLVKIEQFDPTIMVNECARELKLLMKPLGKLRDVHVQVEWIEKIFSLIGPGLNEYLKRLWSREKRLQKKIIALTARYSPVACAALHGRILALPATYDEARFTEISGTLLSGLYGELTGMKEGASAANNAAHLHCMRISVKKYRYTVEILRPILGDGAARLLKRIHAMQTLLGDIHDFDVLIEILARFSRRKKRTKYEVSNIRNSLRKLRKLRREMNARFLSILDDELAAIAPDKFIEGTANERDGQAQG